MSGRGDRPAAERLGQGRSTAARLGARSAAGELPRHALTAAALDAMPRPERVSAIWAALSPSGRERAWAGLDGDRRADALAVLFDASDLDAPAADPPGITSSEAFDRWQRKADR